MVANFAFFLQKWDPYELEDQVTSGVASDAVIPPALLQLMEERRARQRALLCEVLERSLPEPKLQEIVWSYVDTAHPQIGKIAQLIDIAVRCLTTVRLTGGSNTIFVLGSGKMQACSGLCTSAVASVTPSTSSHMPRRLCSIVRLTLAIALISPLWRSGCSRRSALFGFLTVS